MLAGRRGLRLGRFQSSGYFLILRHLLNGHCARHDRLGEARLTHEIEAALDAGRRGGRRVARLGGRVFRRGCPSCRDLGCGAASRAPAGARAYPAAQARGVKGRGAWAHYVTAELEQSTIIDQDVARASHRDSVADLVRKGKDLEKIVLARAVDLHLRNRILVYGNKTVVFD